MPGAEHPSAGKPPSRAKILFGANEEGRKPAPPSPERQPRVLFPAGPAPDAPAPPEAGEPRAPSVLFGAPQPPTPRGTGPKVIGGGAIRRRVPCTVGDLLQLDPAATPAIAGRALRLVEGTNLDDAHFDDVLRFGAELQAEHGAIAEQELAFANAASLQQGQVALANMIRLFGALDPQRVFATRRARFADTLKGLLDAPRSPQEMFAATYPELLALAQSLKALEPQLLALFGGLRQLEGRYAALVDGLASHLLAADFIVRFVRANPVTDGRQGHYLSQAEALETRSASLLATRVTVEMGYLTNGVLRGNAQALIDAGRGMLEEDLPAFHTAYTTALLAAARSPAADAEPAGFQAVRDVHARLLRKLKGDSA